MGIDGNHCGYVETGLETVSPHFVKSITPDKIKPYTIEEWPDVMIDDAHGILGDNHWITLASMMTGLPKETEKDVSSKALSSLIGYKTPQCVRLGVSTHMPLRAMRKNAVKWAPEYTLLRQELLILNTTKISVDMMIERLCRLTS
jgi:radical SAM superfamily enzyme YgiQ (UPF0313 family)